VLLAKSGKILAATQRDFSPDRFRSSSLTTPANQFYIPLLRIALSPNTVGAVGPKGAAMKSIITPVLDNAGIIGFIVEYMPDSVEAYFDGELLGSFSSKAEAAAELLLHTERGAFAQ
jgi:hypothetical protein